MSESRDPQQSPRLQALLDAGDRLEDIREQMDQSPRRRTREHLVEEKIAVRAELRAILAGTPPQALSQALLTEGAESEFSVDEVILVVILLHRRIRHSDYDLSGRELLWVLCDSTYATFRSARYLMPESRLVASGIVSPIVDPDDEPDDALNHNFVLAPRVFRAMSRRQSEAGEPTPASAPVHYLDSAELLLDVNRLSVVFQRRAAKVFDYGVWREIHGEPYESAATLTEQAEEVRDQVWTRLAATPNAEAFELRRFQREFHLSAPEMILVVTLLCQEAMLGNAVIDTLDLIRLLSTSPRDLLRKRRLLDENGTLMANGIIQIDDSYAEKTLTGQSYLASWVAERLIDAPMRSDRKIATDERIEFHNYLSRLDGSDDFFEKLD